MFHLFNRSEIDQVLPVYAKKLTLIDNTLNLIQWMIDDELLTVRANDDRAFMPNEKKRDILSRHRKVFIVFENQEASFSHWKKIIKTVAVNEIFKRFHFFYKSCFEIISWKRFPFMAIAVCICRIFKRFYIYIANGIKFHDVRF